MLGEPAQSRSRRVEGSSVGMCKGWEADLGAFHDAFGRVSDGSAPSLVLPWATPIMKAIFGDDPEPLSILVIDCLPW